MKMMKVLVALAAVVGLMLSMGCKSDCEKAAENMAKLSQASMDQMRKDMPDEKAKEMKAEMEKEFSDEEMKKGVEKCEKDEKMKKAAPCMAGAADMKALEKCMKE